MILDEKIGILEEVLVRKFSFFFMWFGKYFVEEDFWNFEYLKGDYEIDFWLIEVKNIIDSKKNKIGICNRCYECL